MTLPVRYVHTSFSLYCSVLLLFSANSQSGSEERNLHRKQFPIRVALFMLPLHGIIKEKRNGSECMNEEEEGEEEVS